MQFYPRDGNGVVEEFWDGEKLALGEYMDQLTPMVASPHNQLHHYYVNEVCELDDGELFIPKMFLRREGEELWARGYATSCTINVRIVYLENVLYVDLPAFCLRTRSSLSPHILNTPYSRLQGSARTVYRSWINTRVG